MITLINLEVKIRRKMFGSILASDFKKRFILPYMVKMQLTFNGKMWILFSSVTVVNPVSSF